MGPRKVTWVRVCIFEEKGGRETTRGERDNKGREGQQGERETTYYDQHAKFGGCSVNVKGYYREKRYISNNLEV